MRPVHVKLRNRGVASGAHFVRHMASRLLSLSFWSRRTMKRVGHTPRQHIPSGADEMEEPGLWTFRPSFWSLDKDVRFKPPGWWPGQPVIDRAMAFGWERGDISMHQWIYFLFLEKGEPSQLISGGILLCKIDEYLISGGIPVKATCADLPSLNF